VVVVLAVLAVTAFWKPGFLVTEEFDQQALQAGVTQVLTQDYGLGATGVSCPEGQKVEAGTTFTCSANVDGENVEVPVTVLDDQGTYQVGRV
jgi:nicotinamide mononucleotide (NMN) deamidase PncC